MSTTSKPEINLEICRGFFRISTEEAVYNITVLNTPESEAQKVIGTIVDEERSVSLKNEDAIPGVLAEELSGSQAVSDDSYYKQVSSDIYRDIGQLAKSLNATIMDIPFEDRKMKRVELDEAGEKIEDAKKQLKDIVSMTEKATMEIMDHVEKVQSQTDDVKELLSLLKDHQAFHAPEAIGDKEESAGQQDYSDNMTALLENMGRAREIVMGLQEGSSASGEKEEAESVRTVSEKKIRHLFEPDVVFQTLYELCTNEAVKTHITSARERAGEIFDTDTFRDGMSEKVENLEKDADNFYTVPLSGLFEVLSDSCSDKKVQNLLKKMDANQGDIFLEGNLPLEAPSTEEVSGEDQPVEEPVVSQSGQDPRLAELGELMDGGVALAEELQRQSSSDSFFLESCMTKDDQDDISIRINSAFDVAANICNDVNKITEVLSFQDLSGQQILKIIKLLSDFQVQLLAIVVSFGSQLKNKEKDSAITPEESKRLAQEDVDNYMKTLSGVQEEGALDQESVNAILDQLGF